MNLTKPNGWIGVDLDGTLAKYDGWAEGKIGAPVAVMVARVKMWLAMRVEVRVFTARVSDPDRLEVAKAVEAIEAWCVEHIGQKLRVTNTKDFSCIEIWDDRAVQVEINTGRALGSSRLDEQLREAYNRLSLVTPSPKSAGTES